MLNLERGWCRAVRSLRGAGDYQTLAKVKAAAPQMEGWHGTSFLAAIPVK
jgi:hypothetical protein